MNIQIWKLFFSLLSFLNQHIWSNMNGNWMKVSNCNMLLSHCWYTQVSWFILNSISLVSLFFLFLVHTMSVFVMKYPRQFGIAFNKILISQKPTKKNRSRLTLPFLLCIIISLISFIVLRFISNIRKTLLCSVGSVCFVSLRHLYE